jgi:DNA-binding MarR family transcriptional regulator
MDEITDGASGTAVRAARELRVVFSRLLRRLREAAESTDLTPSQTSVLSRLDKEGAASTSDLAAVERVRPQSMASTLAPLDQRGLIRRDPDPEDGRRLLVSLTEAGREWVHGRRLAREEWLARAFQGGYTEAELRTIVEALGLLDRMNRS